MSGISGANLTRYRTTIHATKLAFVVYPAPTIWTAQVSGAQAAGTRAITVDNVVQTRAPAKHFHVLFGSTAGAHDLGEARFISYASGTLNVSGHNTPLADNVYITVLDDVKLDAIHVAIDDNDVVSEDGNEAYSGSLNAQYIPLARCGCDAFAYRDAVSGLATVEFKSDSVAIANGATITDHLWTWRGGTVIAGSTTSAGTLVSPNRVTWDTVGDYLCSYMCTDSNGKTHTRYFVVYIRDRLIGTLPYTSLEVSPIECDTDGGIWKTTLKVFTSASQSAFPLNARCAIVAEDWYGGEKVSIGHMPLRENIVLIGRIRKCTTKKKWSSSYVEIEIESVSGVMAKLWQIAGGLESIASPAGWHQLSGLTFNLAAHHVLTRHSTVSQATDCYLNLPSYTSEYIDLTDTNLLDQLKQIAYPWVRGRVGCSADGTLYLEADPQLLPVASRSTDYTFATDFADFRDEIDLGEELPEKQVDQVDFAGEDANADPVFALAPATPWTMADRTEPIDNIRVADQTEANELAGVWEGKLNNQLTDVTLPLRADYRPLDIFPALPIQVSIAANQNARGIAWTNQRCWIKRVRREYRPGGILLTDIVVEKDAVPSVGVTGEYSVEPPAVPPPTPPPTIGDPGGVTPPPSVPPQPRPGGRGKTGYFPTLKGIIRWNAGLTSPTATAINNGLSTTNLKRVHGFIADPFGHNGTQFTSAWIMTEGGLCYGTNIHSSETWTVKLTEADACTLLGKTVTLLYNFTPDVKADGYIHVLAAEYVGGNIYYKIYWLWSANRGGTWQCDNTKWVGFAPDGVLGILGSLNMTASYHEAGVFYLHGRGTWTANQTYPTRAEWDAAISYPIVLRSTSLPTFEPGARQSVAYGPHFLVWPYCNSGGVPYGTDDHVYGYGQEYDITTHAIDKWDGLFSPAWSPGASGKTPTAYVGDATMSGNPAHTIAIPAIHMFNENRMVALCSIGGYTAPGRDLWTTKDGGATAWTLYPALALAGRSAVKVVSVFMVPGDDDTFWVFGHAESGGAAFCGYTTDFGITWHDVSNPSGSSNIFDAALPGLSNADCDVATGFPDYYET
ncbi:hypothetical protein ANRL1_04841 [Anaerolineae bacterium]|nr:hypothetical protein ANRL1_04841 [Anaerolineae bacterium]